MSNSIVSQELTRGVPTKYLTPKLLAAFEAYSSKLMELNTTAGFTSLTDPNVIAQRHFVEPVGLLHLLLGGLLQEANESFAVYAKLHMPRDI